MSDARQPEGITVLFVIMFGCGLALMFGQVVGSITAMTPGITNLVTSRYTYIKRKTPHFQLTCII